MEYVFLSVGTSFGMPDGSTVDVVSVGETAIWVLLLHGDKIFTHLFRWDEGDVLDTKRLKDILLEVGIKR